MKIGAISDLHIDRHPNLEPKVYLETLVQLIQQRDVALLLIAGDVSNHFQQSYQFIQDLKAKCSIPVLFVPGNHDYWTSESSLTSSEIYDFYVDKPECLIGKPYIINENWAVVGHTAWYDYRYADDKFDLERIQRGKYYGATWQDKVKIDWDIEDRALSKQAANQIQHDLEQVKDKQIILMTHIVTHPQFVVPTPHRIFDFFNAYIGTKDFDAFYQTYPIRYSIMGHVHFRKTLSEAGITYICPCLGYQRQWRTTDLMQELDASLVTFEVRDA
ncbi:metallophosphoesterase [Staphylococcus borealis]|uniref:metallophosphoesterase n=1 Tax=Staphylococcus borealis TaxID=2742203 RepID=UPI000FEE3E98|nr:metallophosphoesterase [Staphylococcus borealis]MDM7864163.1 metallophosphoesterase [Staphylococcus borealis]MDM7883025.1 metallophosphoesterase [Staphylococcus borealis]RIO89742.1 phosphohydrolase [Staphylococcus haemolyticus]